MTKKLSIIIAVLFWVGIFCSVQEAQAITLIPPSYEFQTAPGQTVDTTVKLFNETAESMILYPETRNFTAAGESGVPTFDFEAPIEGLSSWLQLEGGSFILEPGQRVELAITIKVPQDAEPGGHYAALFFSTNPPKTEDEGQIAIGSKIGTLFLVRVEGEIIEKGSIEEFFLGDHQKTLNRLPAELYLRFQNTGNVHLRPTGTITITNLFGKESAKVDLNEAKGATLPETIRKYEAIWEKGQVKETTGNIWSNFWKEYSNEWNNFAFGRYKAEIDLTFGSDSKQTATAKLSFWVLPWRVIVVFALILLVVIFLLIFLIKRYNAWLIKKAKLKK